MDPEKLAELNAYSDRMNKRFALVCDPTDWKLPIRAIVSFADLAETVEAIAFMTATDCTVGHCGTDQFLVRSIGYRAGPAGP